MFELSEAVPRKHYKVTIFSQPQQEFWRYFTDEELVKFKQLLKRQYDAPYGIAEVKPS